MKYPVFICDDDEKQIHEIMEIVGDSEEILSDQEKIKFQVTTSSDYMDAVEKLNKLKSEGGIYFLDIELKKNTEVDSGFDLAKIIK